MRRRSPSGPSRREFLNAAGTAEFPKGQRLAGDDEANALVARPQRAPYGLGA